MISSSINDVLNYSKITLNHFCIGNILYPELDNTLIVLNNIYTFHLS